MSFLCSLTVMPALSWASPQTATLLTLQAGAVGFYLSLDAVMVTGTYEHLLQLLLDLVSVVALLQDHPDTPVQETLPTDNTSTIRPWPEDGQYCTI